MDHCAHRALIDYNSDKELVKLGMLTGLLVLGSADIVVSIQHVDQNYNACAMHCTCALSKKKYIYIGHGHAISAYTDMLSLHIQSCYLCIYRHAISAYTHILSLHIQSCYLCVYRHACYVCIILYTQAISAYTDILSPHYYTDMLSLMGCRLCQNSIIVDL